MLRQDTNIAHLDFLGVTRAVIYARVSGDDRKYSTSGIESQLSDCRKYAKEKGYNIVGEFFEERDKYTSGYEWLPQLEKLLKLAQQQAFDVLIVRELDRLARNRFKQMSIENRLEELGIKVEYVIGQYEDSSEGKLLKGLMGEFAEYERNKIQERMDRGRLKAVEAGKIIIGGSYAPYGYENVDGKLVVNEYEANVVRLIFDLYINQQYVIYAIATYLDAHNVPQPVKGNNHKAIADKENPRGWTDSTIGNILSNETYVGRWHYNKTKSVKNPITGKQKKIKRPRNEWIMVEVPPIIDEITFKEAQERKRGNKRQKRQHKYLFGGMLKCGHCGKSMSGKAASYKDKEYLLYKCVARISPKKYGGKCEDSRSFRASDVDTVVWEWLESILLDPDYLNQLLEEYQNKQIETQRPLLSMIEANQKKLAAYQQEQTRLIDAYTAGVLTLDEIAAKKTELNKQIAELNGAIGLLQAELDPKILSREEINQIHIFAAKVRKGLNVARGSFKTKRKITKLLRVEIALHYIDSEKWAEVKCVLGEQPLAVGYNTTDRNSVARGHRTQARLFRQLENGC
jgi:site-specific DNA recombinase